MLIRSCLYMAFVACLRWSIRCCLSPRRGSCVAFLLASIAVSIPRRGEFKSSFLSPSPSYIIGWCPHNHLIHSFSTSSSMFFLHCFVRLFFPCSVFPLSSCCLFSLLPSFPSLSLFLSPSLSLSPTLVFPCQLAAAAICQKGRFPFEHGWSWCD